MDLIAKPLTLWRILRAGIAFGGCRPSSSGKRWEPAMAALRFNDLRQHSDILRLRNGKSLTVRFVEPADADSLQAYFRSLTTSSRYNRFLGAMSELPQTELDHFTHVGEADRFSVIATMRIDGHETIVGEARYAFDAKTDLFEFGLSIDDRWQGQGIGSALLRNLEAAPPLSAQNTCSAIPCVPTR